MERLWKRYLNEFHMRILSIDTTSTVISAAVYDNERIYNVERSIELRNYESIICLIKTLLKRAKLNIKQIDYFGVCTGPGSFTGIRIGLSTMKALAYCLNKPLIDYRSIDLYAWMFKDNLSGLLCIMQDARRNNIYSAVFRNGLNFQRATPYLLCDISQLIERIRRLTHLKNKRNINLYFYGDAVSEHKEVIKRNFPTSRILSKRDGDFKAKAMLLLTRHNLRNKNTSFSLLPFYMYPKDCQVSLSRSKSPAVAVAPSVGNPNRIRKPVA